VEVAGAEAGPELDRCMAAATRAQKLRRRDEAGDAGDVEPSSGWRVEVSSGRRVEVSLGGRAEVSLGRRVEVSSGWRVVVVDKDGGR
jgi:hypothetical protein